MPRQLTPTPTPAIAPTNAPTVTLVPTRRVTRAIEIVRVTATPLPPTPTPVHAADKVSGSLKRATPAGRSSATCEPLELAYFDEVRRLFKEIAVLSQEAFALFGPRGEESPAWVRKVDELTNAYGQVILIEPPDHLWDIHNQLSEAVFYIITAYQLYRDYWGEPRTSQTGAKIDEATDRLELGGDQLDDFKIVMDEYCQ